MHPHAQIYDFNAGEEVHGVSAQQHWSLSAELRALWVPPALPADLLAGLSPALSEEQQALGAGPPVNPVPGGVEESLPPEPVGKVG